jgi:hypothetical protein
MATDFQLHRFTFPSHTGSAQTQDRTFVFPTNVQRAEAAINGFNYGFTSDDHPLFRQAVDVSILSILLNRVTVRVSFALRDRSSFFDDAYDGFIDIIVIVVRV